jgi:hypothetical protein
MKKTWFPQLIAVFVLAAVAGLYLVPQTLSAEEMNQIVGACDCTYDKVVFCAATSGHKDNLCRQQIDYMKSMCRDYNPYGGSCKVIGAACLGNTDCIEGQVSQECKY